MKQSSMSLKLFAADAAIPRTSNSPRMVENKPKEQRRAYYFREPTVMEKVKAANGLYREFISDIASILFSSPLDVAMIGKTFVVVQFRFNSPFQATKNRLERTPINFPTTFII
ncbi:hypothetical protein TNCV_3107981 [Trichonephila clavipes]|uniref:Uncharacterized protein n=1 Tax=Trichonephila clavipes TaxID=2585209 RepID=A0A8X6S3F7_TRICX|nr:hypothetical protein TNCV_3107981 [Trichonephila clavipes]